jgi:hypothetical protein
MKYICRNCGNEMFENEPGLLTCHDEGCEQNIMKADYGFTRVIEDIYGCWDDTCPYAHHGITDACELTNREIQMWLIEPHCPLKKSTNYKERG